MSLLKPNKAGIEKYKQAIKDYRTAKVTGPDSITTEIITKIAEVQEDGAVKGV